MRSYASDTALPGGKYEPGDATPEDTAVGHSPSLRVKMQLTISGEKRMKRSADGLDMSFTSLMLDWTAC